MISTLEKLTQPTASAIFDTVYFKNIIEDHLSWLIAHPSTNTLPVTAHQVNVYEFDWIGLLSNLNVQPNLFHTVIRMNGGMSYTDVPPLLRAIKVPDPTILQSLVTLISSTSKIQ